MAKHAASNGKNSKAQSGSGPEAEIKASSSGQQTDRYIGRMIGNRFRIEKKIDEGGMGAVYKAFDIETKKAVAVKFIFEVTMEDDKTKRRRFEREAKALDSIKNKHVVGYIKVGQHKGYYMAMEYIEGQSLKDASRDEKGNLKKFKWKRVENIALQICDALNAAHKKNVIHRDIKMENILLGDNDFVKVIDFGLAKPMRKREGEKSLTQAGMVPGTMAYLAPEQLLVGDYDHRVDIYAVGVLMYRMLTGKIPLGGGTDAQTIANKLNPGMEPENLRLIDPSISADVEEVVMKAVARDPEKRYQTMERFMDAISRIADDESTDEHDDVEFTEGVVAKFANMKTETVIALPDDELRVERELQAMQRRKTIGRVVKATVALILAGAAIVGYFRYKDEIGSFLEPKMAAVDQLVSKIQQNTADAAVDAGADADLEPLKMHKVALDIRPRKASLYKRENGNEPELLGKTNNGEFSLELPEGTRVIVTSDNHRAKQLVIGRDTGDEVTKVRLESLRRRIKRVIRRPRQ